MIGSKWPVRGSSSVLSVLVIAVVSSCGCAAEKASKPPPAAVGTRWACLANGLSDIPEYLRSFFWLNLTDSGDSLVGSIDLDPRYALPIRGTRDGTDRLRFDTSLLYYRFRASTNGDRLVGTFAAYDPQTGHEYTAHSWLGYRVLDPPAPRSGSGVWRGTIHGFPTPSGDPPDRRIELQLVAMGDSADGTIEIEGRRQATLEWASLRGDSLKIRDDGGGRFDAEVRVDSIIGVWFGLVEQGDGEGGGRSWVVVRSW
jgi:hypothetical protein